MTMSQTQRALVLLTLLTLGLASANPGDIFTNDISNSQPILQLKHLHSSFNQDTSSPFMRRIFSILFPFSPALNSLLGTFYISSLPNFILIFIPSNISPNTLNTMTAFATGGLLADVFLHLVPHSFVGESNGGDDEVRFVMVEEKRNIVIGLAMFLGFAAFFIMEKTLKVLGGDDDDNSSHGHSHSHSHSHSQTPEAKSSSIQQNGSELRKRTVQTSTNDTQPIQSNPSNGPTKMTAYLNLFGDFCHNITDGLAMSASFYSSPLIGATTTLACCAHEIPHEIGDYSILVRSGFTKRQAMMSQFVTAIGAFIGTFLGIAIHTATASHESDTSELGVNLSASIRGEAGGILGTSATFADMSIPFVAGGFMYIGAVACLPTLLSESKGLGQALREYFALFFGLGCMFLVAWNE